MESKLRECGKHGLTTFRPYSVKTSKGRTTYYKCGKCNTEQVQRRRDQLKILAVEYKGGCCEICGYSKYVGALEFHHIDPSLKDFSISGSGYTRSFEKMKPELDKCRMLCANCHREIHAKIKASIS